MTDRISDQFRSAGAVRTNRPSRDSQDSVLTRHAELIAAIIAAKPHVIRYEADAHDLKDRADHIDAIGRAVQDYISEILDDTAYNAHGVDRDCGGLSDAFDDVAGNIMAAAEEKLKDEGHAGGFW